MSPYIRVFLSAAPWLFAIAITYDFTGSDSSAPLSEVEVRMPGIYHDPSPSPASLATKQDQDQ